MDKQEKYELTITADSITSTDSRFTMNDLGLGDNYKPLDVHFVKADGEEVRRKKNKGERSISNQTLPRLAFQVYEQNISVMSVEERETFPVCQYKPSNELISGIFNSIEEFKKSRNTLEFC